MIILHENEKLILEVRRHWFMFFLEVIPFIFGTLLPLVFWTVNSPLTGQPLFLAGPQSYQLFVFLTVAWYLALWLSFFQRWTLFYLDVWLVSDHRVVNVEQKAFFSREVSECRLDNIQDMTYEVAGILATFLNYGDLSIETAGEEKIFAIKAIPDPVHVKQVISELQGKVIPNRLVKN